MGHHLVSHLLPIEHAGRNADDLYYVMPLTLAAVIEQRAGADTWFSCDEIASWICPVLEALQTLSDAGSVHRDVKPDNILVFGGKPALAGISLLGADGATLTRRGTPGYACPSWYAGGHPDMYSAAEI